MTAPLLVRVPRVRLPKVPVSILPLQYTPASLRSGQNWGLGERRPLKGPGWGSEHGSGLGLAIVTIKQMIKSCFSTILGLLNKIGA